MSGRKAVDEAVHFPGHVAVTCHAENYLQPIVVCTHALRQQPCFLYAVLPLLPEHFQDLLLAVIAQSNIGIVEEATCLYRRELPEIACEDDVDTSK